MLQDFAMCLEDALKVFSFLKRRQNEPSYLAYNVVWFTNCSWLEQLSAFKQLDCWYDYSKRDYLLTNKIL